MKKVLEFLVKVVVYTIAAILFTGFLVVTFTFGVVSLMDWLHR